MAKYYFNAEVIPNYVVQYNLNGEEMGISPQSSSLTWVGGDIFNAKPVSGFYGIDSGNLKEIEWDLCVPLPSAYGTTLEKLTYLSTIFTGQMGSSDPKPPTKSTMIIVSQQAELQNATDYYTSPSGIATNSLTATQTAVSLGAVSITDLIISIFENSADADTLVEIIKIDKFNVETVIHSTSITVGSVGVISSTVSGGTLLSGDRVCIRYVVAATTGDTYITGTTLVCE